MSELAGRETVAGPLTPAHGEAYLSLWDEHAEQRRWPLPADGGVVTIGRSSTADVCLAGDARVSRVHVILERVGGLWTVVDDGLSRNGTLLNGRRLTHRVRLRDRDKIKAGGTVLTFCAPPQTATQQTVADGALPMLPRLTDRQRSVLAALCRPERDDACVFPSPATNQQIARKLFLSVDAVKTHLRVLFHKFGIDALPQNQKRTRLVQLAEQLGLADQTEP